MHNPPNRRIRTRTYGGVGGAEPQGSPLSRYVDRDQTSRTATISKVPGSITKVLVAEGQTVTKGTPLIHLDDSIQRATTEQQGAQLEAARALLDELKSRPKGYIE